MASRGYSIQTNFSAGMLDEASIARFDVEAYKSGGLDVTNMLGLPLGGVTLRGGLAWFATVASGGDNARLLRFEFSTEQVYLMLVRALAIDVYLPDGTLAATVTTTYTADEIAALSWVQSLDTLILVHPDHAPAKLVRSGSHTSWTLSTITLTNVPQYDFGSGNENVWSATRGWPRSVFLHQGRLYFGGSRARPQTVWGSGANDFFDFATTSSALDDEAVELTFDNDRVCAVQQLYALNDFFAFTKGGLFARVADDAITPQNFFMRRSSEVPAARLRPAEIDGSVMYASYGEESGFSTIYEVIFDYDTQSYRAEDVALLSSALMRQPVDMAARRGNETNSANHLYVVNGEDGTVAVLNSRKVQKMTGWTLLTTGGEILAVAVVGNIPYFLVHRVVAENSIYTIERLDPDRRLDCSVAFTAETATDTWDDDLLDFYEGETVDLIGDGAPLGQAVVTGGAITAPYAVSSIEIGFSFDWAVETMPAMVDGSEIMERHRIVRASIVVENTAGMTVNGRPIADQFVGDDLLDRPPQPFTGTKPIRFLGWRGGRAGGRGATVRITGTSANPATILAVAAEVAQ